MTLPRARSLEGLMAAACIAAVFFSVFYQSNRFFDAANVDKAPRVILSSQETEEFLDGISSKVIKHLEKKIAKLGEPQPGMPYSLPDVLHRLDATSFPDNTWEVFSAKYSWKMNLTESEIRYWANQVREAHIIDLGTHTFAARCILAFNREDYVAVELLWGWKVFLGTDYSDKKSRCWRTSYTLSEMRTLASMQPSGRFTLDFVDEINDICGE